MIRAFPPRFHNSDDVPPDSRRIARRARFEARTISHMKKRSGK
jgi:hypothetical protein